MTEGPSCPLPLRHGTIVLGHGAGGRLTRELVERLILPAFASTAGAARHDAAVLPRPAGRLAFTTDTYVVTPRFFPGGDIGKLAVFGTVNDLAMAGARPTHLSVALLLEEGLALEELGRVVASMAEAAREAGVELVTGDTKVVDRGKGDGLYITTAGVGVVADGVAIAPKMARPGDVVLLSGDVGRHGIAVLSQREGLTFETALESDCAPVAAAVHALLDAGVPCHVLRDPTRGGLASALCEIAADGGVGIELEEPRVPIVAAVAAACELFGLDPLYVACEGRFLAIVPREDGERALALLRGRSDGAGAAIVGEVVAEHPGVVLLRTPIGSRRVLELLTGEQLPRIC